MPGTSYSSSSQNTWFTAYSRDTQETVTERLNSHFPSKAMTIQFRSGWGDTKTANSEARGKVYDKEKNILEPSFPAA